MNSLDLRGTLVAAAEWRLLSLLFERPRPGWVEDLEAVGREISDPALVQAVAEARTATPGAYIAVFGPGGSVSPREVAYRAREDPGRIVADIAAFYQAFAFQPRAEDPVDHVAVEAGFAGYLRLKEAFARSRGDAEGSKLCAQAFAQFVESHLRLYAEPLSRRLALAPHRHLARAGRALLECTGASPAAGMGPDHGDLSDVERTDCAGGDFPSCDGCV